MSNVVILPVVTRLDIPAERILNGALEKGLDSCIVIGRTKDGDIYFSASMADGGEALWLLEKSKIALLGEAD
jgi:hypothetical protein